MRFLLTILTTCVLGCSAPKTENDRPSQETASDAGKAISLIGTAKETLSNGIFTAHLEKVEQDIEDETGLRPGESVFRFHVVIGNAVLVHRELEFLVA